MQKLLYTKKPTFPPFNTNTNALNTRYCRIYLHARVTNQLILLTENNLYFTAQHDGRTCSHCEASTDSAAIPSARSRREISGHVRVDRRDGRERTRQDQDTEQISKVMATDGPAPCEAMSHCTHTSSMPVWYMPSGGSHCCTLLDFFGCAFFIFLAVVNGSKFFTITEASRYRMATFHKQCSSIGLLQCFFQ